MHCNLNLQNFSAPTKGASLDQLIHQQCFIWSPL